jgi:anti-sigma factor ChrR (cupin superfamily)
MGGQRKRPPLERSLTFRSDSDWIAAGVRQQLPNVYAIRRTPQALWAFRGRRVTLDARTEPWIFRLTDARGAVIPEQVDARHGGHGANDVIVAIVHALNR